MKKRKKTKADRIDAAAEDIFAGVDGPIVPRKKDQQDQLFCVRLGDVFHRTNIEGLARALSVAAGAVRSYQDDIRPGAVLEIAAVRFTLSFLWWKKKWQNHTSKKRSP